MESTKIQLNFFNLNIDIIKVSFIMSELTINLIINERLSSSEFNVKMFMPAIVQSLGLADQTFLPFPPQKNLA